VCSVGCFRSGESNFLVKPFCSTAANGVGNKGDDDGEDDEANNSEYTSYCSSVVKEARGEDVEYLYQTMHSGI